MKQLYNFLISLPFRSFQFRLLLYLLLVGSIPLVCAMFVFYEQSSDYARNELLANVNRTHEQIIQRLEAELANLEHVSKNMNADYLVQSYLESDGLNLINKEDIFKSHLDYLIYQQKANSNYITDICFGFSEAGTSICSNSKIYAETRTSPVSKTDLSYELFADERNIPFGIKFAAPLLDLNTSIVKGQIFVIMNLGKLMGELEKSHVLYRQVLLNNQGSVIYRSGEKMEAATLPEYSDDAKLYIDDRTGNIVSQSKLRIKNVNWLSHIEVKNEFLTSTWRSLRNTLVLFFGILFLLSIVSSFIFSIFVTRPLLNLRKLFKRAELGDLQAYWTFTSTDDINDLGEGYNQMLNRVSELIKQVKYEEALKKDAEIKALQYQLNPHFLYNTLNTIKWVAKIHKTPQISEVVSALVRLLQASLGKKGEFITIKEEILLITDYMEIQNFRYGEKVKVEFDIEQVAALCLVPRMILQPLVENALIHGIEPMDREGIITIKAWIDRDLLMCQVEDNGKGIPESELTNEELLKSRSVKEKMSGIGLKHIREKIKLYYGPDYKMHVFSKPNQGTTVRLSLPIHRNEE